MICLTIGIRSESYSEDNEEANLNLMNGMQPPIKFPCGRNEASVYLLNPDTRWPLLDNNLQFFQEIIWKNWIHLESFIIIFLKPNQTVAHTHTHTQEEEVSK